jgi:hypothetical protein
VVIVIGGQFISWNSGLADVGAGSLILAVLVMGLAYLILIASMAEMAGALPFSGTILARDKNCRGCGGGEMKSGVKIFSKTRFWSPCADLSALCIYIVSLF